MLYTVEHQRVQNSVAGPYSVTVFRHPGDEEDRRRAVIMACITGIGSSEACDERAIEKAQAYNARLKTSMLSTKYALVVAEMVAPRDQVAQLVRDAGGSCSPGLVCYYPSIDALALKARSSRHWAIGTTMVWAPKHGEFVVLNQVAPDSCEFMLLTPKGVQDVLSCSRYDQDGLVEQILIHVERMEEEAAEH